MIKLFIKTMILDRFINTLFDGLINTFGEKRLPKIGETYSYICTDMKNYDRSTSEIYNEVTINDSIVADGYTYMIVTASLYNRIYTYDDTEMCLAEWNSLFKAFNNSRQHDNRIICDMYGKYEYMINIEYITHFG